MGWIIGCTLMGILAALCALGARKAKQEWKGKNEDGSEFVKDSDAEPWYYGLKIGMWATIGGITLYTVLACFQIVNAGHVRVVTSFGNVVGQRAAGFTAIWPWQDTVDFSTRTTTKKFDHLEAFSKETQDVFVDASLIYHISPDAIQKLYTQVGSDWYDKLVPSRVFQTLKDVTVKYTATNIAPNREAIRRIVKDRLETQLGANSISVDDFLLNNVDFDKSFKEAILDKQKATQESQAAQNRVQKAQFEAQQQVATAQGEATATLVKATAQAKANKLLTFSITPELIQYQYVTKLAPNVQAIVPQGSNLVVPASIFGK